MVLNQAFSRHRVDNTPRFEARGGVGRAHQVEGAGDHAEQLTRSKVAVPAVV